MNEYKNLPLRPGVGIILLNSEDKVFVGKRVDNPLNFWQMPQGGIDKNEKVLEAAIRELKEETGITTVKLIKELNYWLEYDLPKNLIDKIWKGKYRGQRQKWFIMQFIGNKKDININTEHPEFLEWKWIHYSELPKIVVNFKVKVYEKLVDELKNLLH